jgi:uncharacterized protein YaiI (UPF0178 family)
MLPWIFRRASKRVPWGMVLTVSVWLAQKGRERVERNLTHSERQELLRLVGKSKGRPSNLSQRDRTRVRNLASKAIRG